MFSRFKRSPFVTCYSSPYSASGFSFIEVLVSAFVFTGALLPLWHVALDNLQSSRQLTNKYAANMALNNLAQNIWLNREYLAVSGLEAEYFNESLYQERTDAPCAEQFTNCHLQPCSFQELAKYDIAHFICTLSAELGSYSVEVNQTESTVAIAIFLNGDNTTSLLAETTISLAP
ncbi:MAG: hypothetical protein HWE10_06335 [Gammaproteobacteria bacterium]|nr:hypothetical protein [Gammaproteobacteria bacterium]